MGGLSTDPGIFMPGWVWPGTIVKIFSWQEQGQAHLSSYRLIPIHAYLIVCAAAANIVIAAS